MTGIRAELSQVQRENDIRPVAFASRTLTPAEKKYSQLERETLGIVFGVTRFRNYLLGNSFTLRTDHKPLVTLFSENKGIPTIAANRIQRWAIILSAYQYKNEYIKGTSKTEADVLSRLPMFTPEQNPEEHDSEPVEMVLLMDALDRSPVTSDDIRVGFPGDPSLRQALDHTLQGWSEETPKEMELMPYWSRRYELGDCEDLLFWGNRVIIPTNLRAKMLDELHNRHQCIVGLKSVARTLFWWPGLDKDIEETVRRCNCCQGHASMPPRTTPVNWPSTNQPWYRVHIDHLGPFEQNLYLIVVDACTKWIEAIPVPNTSTRETIEQLRCLFARFGIPIILVSDSGTGFTSEEFRQFMTRNGIRHLRTAPFHPNSNGLAERAVQTIKTGLKKVQQGSISQRLTEILLGYRRAPVASIGKSLSEMKFGHNIRSHLDLILPNPGKSEEPSFKVGESVWYRTYKSGPNWDQASIKGFTGNRLVKLETAKGQVRRHWNQIRRSRIPGKRSESTEDHAGVSEPDINTEPEELIPQRQ
ncbi:K02A2.6-like [Cordylochernes scorpioides]|uniref:RNA-directed DNA polymerase n=1 Tax=Cordylochernes scorpioides TaxID=51811 RepID=A0ABY6L2S5_9ARAC|nr:K02A2.6-like [Cordylochernes scorpioides]